LVYENVCMTISCRQSVFQRYHSEKHLSEFYPQHGGESQLASKLRHCHPIAIPVRPTVWNEIYQTDFRQIFRVGRTLAVDNQSEISFSLKGRCHGNQSLLVLSHRTDSLDARRGGVRRMNQVTLRRARLALGWVTVFGHPHHCITAPQRVHCM